MFGLEIDYNVPFFIADMKKRCGTDFPPTALHLQLQKLLELQGRLVKFLTDVSFMLMVSAVLYCVVTEQHVLHATRSSHEKAVCLSVHPSVCLSVKHVDCNKTEESSAKIFIPYERSFSLMSKICLCALSDSASRYKCVYKYHLSFLLLFYHPPPLPQGSALFLPNIQQRVGFENVPKMWGFLRLTPKLGTQNCRFRVFYNDI